MEFNFPPLSLSVVPLAKRVVKICILFQHSNIPTFQHLFLLRMMWFIHEAVIFTLFSV